MGEQINNTGNSKATLSNEVFEYSPVTGNTLVLTFRGDNTAITAKENEYKALGATTSRRNLDSHLYELSVRVDVDLASSAPETPVDTFRWDDEFYTEDNLSNPRVTKPTNYPNISNFPSSGQPGSVTAAQMASIEKIVSLYQSGDSTYQTEWSTLLASNPWAADVAYFRIRGITSYEIKRPVLTRIRTYSTKYTQRKQIEAVPTVFKTQTLVTAESFPDVIKNQMPPDPSVALTPPLTAWGWRMRAQSSEVIPQQAKIAETTSWTFAAWPITFYEHV